MIRPTIPADTPALLTMARETGVFKPMEIVALNEVLDDYHAANRKHGHQCVSYDRAGQPIGFAYFAPAAMTDRTWDLYWIVVQKQLHAKGIGSDLLQYVEEQIRQAKGRLLLIDTSSLPLYEPTRRFYQKHGYEVEAVIRDFYADGDDKVIFRKHF